MDKLTQAQKDHFKSISGYEYDDKKDENRFKTDRPYDNDDWKMSPWYFTYIIDEKTENLYCMLSHRMTNPRCYGYDKEGNDIKISEEDFFKMFK
jgi:hypothetical protein